MQIAKQEQWEKWCLSLPQHIWHIWDLWDFETWEHVGITSLRHVCPAGSWCCSTWTWDKSWGRLTTAGMTGFFPPDFGNRRFFEALNHHPIHFSCQKNHHLGVMDKRIGCFSGEFNSVCHWTWQIIRVATQSPEAAREEASVEAAAGVYKLTIHGKHMDDMDESCIICTVLYGDHYFIKIHKIQRYSRASSYTTTIPNHNVSEYPIINHMLVIIPIQSIHNPHLYDNLQQITTITNPHNKQFVHSLIQNTDMSFLWGFIKRIKSPVKSSWITDRLFNPTRRLQDLHLSRKRSQRQILTEEMICRRWMNFGYIYIYMYGHPQKNLPFGSLLLVFTVL